MSLAGSLSNLLDIVELFESMPNLLDKRDKKRLPGLVNILGACNGCPVLWTLARVLEQMPDVLHVMKLLADLCDVWQSSWMPPSCVKTCSRRARCGGSLCAGSLQYAMKACKVCGTLPDYLDIVRLNPCQSC